MNLKMYGISNQKFDSIRILVLRNVTDFLQIVKKKILSKKNISGYLLDSCFLKINMVMMTFRD